MDYLIRKYSPLTLFVIIFLLFSPYTTKAELKEVKLEDIEYIRVLNHNNLPKKIIIRNDSPSYDPEWGNYKTVDRLKLLVDEINANEGLEGRQKIQLITVGEKDDVVKHKEIPHIPIEHKHVGGRWIQDGSEIMMAKIKDVPREQLLIGSTYGEGKKLEHNLGEKFATLWNGFHIKLTNETKSGNFGGNIEVTPNDVLYIGSNADSNVRSFFIDHGYSNKHVLFDVDWLSVGHVDEIVTTINLPDDPCGFALVKSDPNKALKILNELSEEEKNRLKLDRKKIKDYLSPEVITKQKEFSRRIDLNIKQLKEKVESVTKECKDLKVISIPELYYCEPPMSRGTAEYMRGMSEAEYKDYLINFEEKCESLLPASINMLVLRKNLIIPETYFPPFDRYILEELKKYDQNVHFIDTKNYYSDGGGEIHCGTDVLRLPNEYIVPSKELGNFQTIVNALGPALSER
jgi:hypothetical protein